jgi:gliding motility-associated-like protein
MRPYLLSLSLSLSIFHPARAQYADLGSGTLKNHIWWLDWAGFVIANGASRSFQTSNGSNITVTFSDVTSNYLHPSIMNTWSGACLHLLYDFSDPAIRPALYDGPSTSAASRFKMTVTVTQNGSPVPFSMVAADAEASDMYEQTTLQTNGASWSIIELFRNSTQTTNPVTGCGSQQATISNTFGNRTQIGQTPIIATRNPAPNPLIVDITVDHTIRGGGMGVAFGILGSVDRGDLPPSYGTAQHELALSTTNSCNYLPPLPLTSQEQRLKIGAIGADPDPVQTADDNTTGPDEDGIASFPVYDNSGSYTLNIPLSNTTGGDAWLTGWFDLDRNEKFDPGESVTAIVPANAASADLTWTGLPAFLPAGTAAGYGFRLRLSSSQQESQAATGNAQDGEVEDYFVPSAVLCSISVTAKPDTIVCPGSPIPLLATGDHITQYTWTGGAGISDPSIASPVATPPTAASYTVTASNPQACQARATIQVAMLPGTTIIKSNDTTICEGRTVTLSAAGGANNSWTSSDGLLQTTGPSITVSPAQSTKYYVQVTGGTVCSSHDSIAVQIHFPPTFQLKPKFPYICKYDSILLVASGGHQYAWSSGTTGPIPGDKPRIVAWLDAEEDFQVKITDTICQLTSTLSTHVLLRPQPVTTVTKSNDIDCTQGKATLHAEGGSQYVWDPAPGITDLGSSDPVVHPLAPTMYKVTVTGTNGCSGRDSITVETDYTTALSKYPVPSAFTPDNDGHNDCFGLKYWGSVLSLEMEVMNRWGQRLFISRAPNDCWDGTFKGTPQPAGAYIYQIRAITPCGTAYRKGTVLLIR